LISGVAGIRRLSDEELACLAQAGDAESNEVLVGRYRSLVGSRARSYYMLGGEPEDLMQEGYIGLCKAIRDFRADRGDRFACFAELCVTRSILTALKSAQSHKHGVLSQSVSFDDVTWVRSRELPLSEVIPSPLHTRPDFHVLQQPRIDARQFSSLETNVLQRYLAGQSYTEMSSELACSTKAVDNALQRVKKKLSAVLF